MTNTTLYFRWVLGAFVVALFAALAFVLLPGLTNALTLSRQLQVGMSGTDVSALQTFLAADASIYPQGLVTGYFGFLTKAAVSNFQKRNGISAVGRVGPQTIAFLGGMNSIGGSGDMSSPIITSATVSTTTSSATVTWTTNEATQGTLYYSITPISLTENLGTNPTSVFVTGSSVVSTNAGLQTAHTVNVQNLQANTMYYYVVHATDMAGNVNVRWPSTFRTGN
ncbi:MAG: peptidoglycan-binding domain-containing protein [Minisyncoccia bacterium]